MASYIIYEKKDSDGIRHLYGHWGSNIPDEADSQVVYKDASGSTSYSPALSFNDVYLDAGKGCIKRKSDNAEVNVYVKDSEGAEHLVAGEITIVSRILSSITVSGITDPQGASVEKPNLDLSGMVVTAIYRDGTSAKVSPTSISPENGSVIADIDGVGDSLDVVVTYTEDGVTKSGKQTIEISL